MAIMESAYSSSKFVLNATKSSPTVKDKCDLHKELLRGSIMICDESVNQKEHGDMY